MAGVNEVSTTKGRRIMNHPMYPQSLDFECVRTLVRILRDGTLSDNKQVAGKCIWSLQGYAQYMALGDPDDPDVTPIGEVAISEDDASGLLNLLHALDPALTPAEGVIERLLERIDWKRVLPVLLDLLLRSIA
jgi:hypothetical protein